jgi:predicted PolB exonuclease-like 3'-5' exonuclease
LRGESSGVSDTDVYAAWLEERKAKGQSDFMPLYLQRIVVISLVFRNAEGLRVHSFVDKDDHSEGKVIQTFFNRCCTTAG